MCTNNCFIFHIFLLRKACRLTSVWNGIFARFGEASGRRMTLLLRSCHCENALLGTPETSRRNFLGLGLCHFDIFFFGSTKLINEKKVVKIKPLQIHTWSQRRCIQIYMISVEIQFSLILTEKLGGEGIKPSWITSKITLIHVIEILKIHVVKL